MLLNCILFNFLFIKQRGDYTYAVVVVASELIISAIGYNSSPGLSLTTVAVG
jgi:hypothetical protein